jgi:ornithine cyclodeaminase
MPDFQRVPASPSTHDALECVFCGRTTSDGADLIAANDAAICDECAAACAETMNAAADEDATDSSAGASSGPRALVSVLAESDVEQLLNIDALVDTVEETVRRVSSDRLPQPASVVLTFAGGRVGLTLACATPPGDDTQTTILGAQLTSAIDGNAVVGLPTTRETILLLSAETGALLAIVAGRYLVDACAAAMSAVSARLLANDDAGRLAILGSGRIARVHLDALERVFELSSVRIWSQTSEDQEALIEQIESDVPIEAAHSAENAVRSADLVVIAVPPNELLVRPEWIADGTHVMIAGLSDSDARDATATVGVRGRVFVESRTPATGRDVLLGDVAHKRSDGRRSDREVTIFEAVGMTNAHLAAANLAFRIGAATDKARQVEL